MSGEYLIDLPDVEFLPRPAPVRRPTPAADPGGKGEECARLRAELADVREALRRERHRSHAEARRADLAEQQLDVVRRVRW